jgi:hypothetical protein
MVLPRQRPLGLRRPLSDPPTRVAPHSRELRHNWMAKRQVIISLRSWNSLWL